MESYRLTSHTDRIIQDNLGQDDVTLFDGGGVAWAGVISAAVDVASFGVAGGGVPAAWGLVSGAEVRRCRLTIRLTPH